jgi:DNA-binding transcriptional MerR regulator
VSTFTIGEIAERSGFSASALRYYEGIGLVPAATRTPAGYRLYDDDTLSRLTFIARAKQLGCSLEEITDLVGIWDGERCGPVQKRFHDLVTTKLADTQRQIDELTALADQLRHAALQLAGPATDGACSEQCACLALEAATAPVVRTAKAGTRGIPLYDATASITCTADGSEIASRLQQIERMHTAVVRAERTEHGVLLHFPNRPDIEADVRQFTVDEKGCCSFWGFEVTVADDEIALRWDAPPTLDAFMDTLLDHLEGDEPITAASGLL